ncbi:bifunctional precorrin-2 dehydrogenase/sirohydrochlorin ferrochelatase [Paenibacillus sp. GCM10027626]|uniref:precorrin-2 dehydrogenase/sirohydrochlorin ferrochelatase family protein n=1 Tax=Paenibacillus sp. GCM10027626 TaxID=3273411 RepID=UPI00363F9EF6
MADWYPLLLNLRGKRCVVIGGGQIAERKIRGLLEGGADRLLVISPDSTAAIRTMAEVGVLTWRRRYYDPSDLQQACLVFAATDDPLLNGIIAQEADKAGALVNVSSEAGQGNFITPSVIRRDQLIMTVTTGGASPALAAAIARSLEERYGAAAGQAVSRLGQLRRCVKRHVPDRKERQAILYLAAQEMEAMLAEQDKQHQQGEEQIVEWMERLRQQAANKEGHQ